MERVFGAINGVFSFIGPLSDFLWEFPTNFGSYSSIPILGNISFAIILLLGSGIFFSFRIGFMQVTYFKKGIRTMTEKRVVETGISPLASFFLSSAMRVGPGNILGVTGAIAAGGPGALFWMWISAFFGMAVAYMEGVLAQIFKEKKDDEFVGGLPFYGRKLLGNKVWIGIFLSVLYILYALCCLPAQGFNVVSSVGRMAEIITGKTIASGSAFYYIVGTLIVILTAAIAFGGIKKVSRWTDMMVPVMAVLYFVITLFIIFTNLGSMPGVFKRIFEEAFGIRQVAAGGFGAVLMNGVKRGLFSNEAGSGSAPCAAAAAECDQPVKAGFVQALGVFVDTIVICSCTAMIMLLAPEDLVSGLSGMELLQTAMRYHLGEFGVIFIAATLFMFSFSTFLGILFYARSNVAYLFGDNWASQTGYKIIALVMLFIGGIAAYTFVWDLGDVGIGLMTIFNIFMLYPLGGKAIRELKNYEEEKKIKKV